MSEKKYWIGLLGPVDDFSSSYKDIMYDGKTKMGPWANMTEESWKKYGCGRVGQGYAQKYQRQEDGKWLKIAG